MKLNKEIAYTIIAKSFFNCRFNELKQKQQDSVVNWWEDNQDDDSCGDYDIQLKAVKKWNALSSSETS